MRSGTTLIEIIVVLVILALLSTITAPALVSHTRKAESPSEILSDSLAAAVEECRDVHVTYRAESHVAYATAWCDGTVVSDSTFHVRPDARRDSFSR